MPHATPKPGLLIRDPFRGDHLPPEGREVERTAYWRRRERDGDVTLTAAPPAPAPNSKKKEG